MKSADRTQSISYIGLNNPIFPLKRIEKFMFNAKEVFLIKSFLHFMNIVFLIWIDFFGKIRRDARLSRETADAVQVVQ